MKKSFNQLCSKWYSFLWSKKYGSKMLEIDYRETVWDIQDLFSQTYTDLLRDGLCFSTMLSLCWVRAELDKKCILDGILHNNSHSITYFVLLLWLSSAESAKNSQSISNFGLFFHAEYCWVIDEKMNTIY